MQYQLDMAAVMNDAKTSGASNRGAGDLNATNVAYLKLKDGLTTIRILPVPANSPYKRMKPWFSITKHWGFMGPRGKVSAIACGMDQHGKCPLCQLSDNLRGETDPELNQRGYDTRAQMRFVYTVLSNQNEVGILEVDDKVHNAILGVISTYRSQDPNFNPFDLQTGRWLDIRKSKDPNASRQKFVRNVYVVAPHLQQTPVPQSILDKYSEVFIYPEKINPRYTYEQLMQIVKGDWSFLVNKETEDTSFNPSQFQQPPAGVMADASSPAPKVWPNATFKSADPLKTQPTVPQQPAVPQQNSIDDELKNLIGDI